MSAPRERDPVCERVLEALSSGAAGGPLGGPDSPGVRAHLGECEPCAEWAQGFRETLALLGEAELQEPPEGFHTRLLAKLEGVQIDEGPEEVPEGAPKEGPEGAEVDPGGLLEPPASAASVIRGGSRRARRLWPMVAVFLCGAAVALAGVWVAEKLKSSPSETSAEPSEERQGEGGGRSNGARSSRLGSGVPSKGPSLLDFFWNQIQESLQERNRLREPGGLGYQSGAEPRERLGSRESAARESRESRERSATPGRRGPARLGDPKGVKPSKAEEPREGAGGGAAPRGAGNGDESALRKLLRRKRLENRAKLDERQRRKLQERLEERRRKDQSTRHQGRAVGPDGAGGAGGGGRRHRGGH